MYLKKKLRTFRIQIQAEKVCFFSKKQKQKNYRNILYGS